MEIAMQTGKFLTGLVLCAFITLPQYTPAASFCATSPEGNIRVDDCKYNSYDECKRAVGTRGDCVANHEENPPASTVAPYCVVTWGTECKYYDYETCARTAKQQVGFCYKNPEYKNPDK